MGSKETKWSTDLKEKEKTTDTYIYTNKSKIACTESKKKSSAILYLTKH